MFKKFLSAVTALCLLCTVISAVSFAESSFSDVISPDYDWAMDEIEEMTTIGIIKGYTDGTFRPATSVKKIEALIFLARAVGFSNTDYEPFTEYAYTLYSPILDEYDLGSTYNSYKKEVAFLLYKDVLHEDELDEYLDDASSALKRYEAAVLLTKLMGAEDEVKNNTAVLLDYSDYNEIPASARAYVEYVTQEGLMNGLEDNCFGPNENVTRVQIAILLHRILNTLDYSTVAGTVRSVNAENSSISIYNEEEKKNEEYSIDAKKVTVLKDGFAVNSLDGIADGSTALVLYSGSSIKALEVISPAGENETVAGRLADITIKTDYTSFYVINDKTSESREFKFLAKSEPEVTYNGKETKFSALSAGDYVTVTVKNGAVTAIDGESGDKTVTGTVRDISLSPEYSLSVRLTDDNGTSTSETVDYSVSDEVTVTRNGSKSTLREVLSGDKVTLTLKGGIVTKIVATSTKSNASGTISSILISSSPKLGIRSGGEETLYSISADAVYYVGGDNASIYDLRLGTSVDVDLEGDSVTSVTASAASTSYQKSGIIEDINTSYGFINLNMDGDTEQIFVSKSGSTTSATIVDSSTGKTLTFSKLQKGQIITAVGSYVNGAFVATTIVVIPSEN